MVARTVGADGSSGHDDAVVDLLGGGEDVSLEIDGLQVKGEVGMTS